MTQTVDVAVACKTLKSAAASTPASMQARQQRDYSNEPGFLDKAKQAFEAKWQHTTLCSASDIAKRWSDAVAKAGRRLPFDCVDDPGLVVEDTEFRRDLHQHLPVPLTEEEVKNDPNKVSQTAREELREAAWLAAGQHGFAALAGLPELQQMIAYTCLPLAEEATNPGHWLAAYEVSEGERAAYVRKVAKDDERLLLQHVPHQLRMCLLAEVAAGMLCPGLGLPPDTAEHGAALYEFLHVAWRNVEVEVAEATQPPFTTCQQETLSTARAAASTYVQQHVDLQLHVAGHHLLDMLCQVIEGPDSSSSSSSDCGGGSDSSGGGGQARGAAGRHCNVAQQQEATAAMPAAPSLSSQQRDALEMLMWQWQPVLQMCQALQQKGSSDAAEHIYSQCLSAMHRLMRVMHGTVCHDPDTSSVTAEKLPWRLLKGLQTRARYLHPSLDDGDITVTGQAISEQLRLLVGGLVLQFVQRARAAGGIAWQQEVPLQVLVLLGALEQLQGLLLTVQQEDVAAATEAAAAHDMRQRAVQAAAAEALAGAATVEATAAEQEWKQQMHQNLQNIPIAVDNSSGEGSGSEDLSNDDQDSGMEYLEQQASHHQQCQCDPGSAAQQQPNKQLMHALMKVLEILQLTRQFEELNKTVNSGAAAGNSSAAVPHSSSADSAASAASVSDAPCLSWEALCSPSGPLNAWYPEPRTLCGWGVPAAGGSCTAAGSATAVAAVAAAQEEEASPGIDSTTCSHQASAVNEPATAAVQSAGSSSSSKQQLPGGAVGKCLQQLCADAFGGALLLFKAQEAAHSTLGSTLNSILQDPRQDFDAVVVATIRQLLVCEGFDDLERQLQQAAESTGVSCSSSLLIKCYALGSAIIEAARQQYSRKLEQAGVETAWTTIHDAGESSAVSVGGTGSSSSGGSSATGKASIAGRQYGAYGRLRRQTSQQQNAAAAAAAAAASSETVPAIKQGGKSMLSCLELLEQQIEQPVQGWLKGWWHNREKQLHAAHTWGNDPERRTVLLATNLEQHSSTQKVSGGSMFNRITQGISTSISSSIAWATSSKHSDAVSPEPGTGSSEPIKASNADFSSSHSNSSSKGGIRPPGQYNRLPTGCPLCHEELAAGAGSSNGSAAPYSSWPVSWDDPFFWRRLLWQLLGRLKPSAQQWYAEQFGMCPHSTNDSLWRSVRFSVAHCLWLPPDANPVLRRVAFPDVGGKNMRRARRLAQYARAITAAYYESYSSSAAALLSQQVLLALSPLHQAVRPAQETAALCPSSFGPAVGHMLAQKLGLGRLLLKKWHIHNPNATLRMWHVWFHIGIRRYYWVQKQQQHQHQHQLQELNLSNNARKKLKARQQQQQPNLRQLPAETLQQLYLDPDARYYAVGFAARQLAPYQGGWGCSVKQEGCIPHISRSQLLAERVLKMRMNLMMSTQLARPEGDRQRTIHRVRALCKQMMKIQRKMEAGQVVEVLPPAFLPVNSLGLESDDAWQLHTETHSKAGEAVRLTTWPCLLDDGLHMWREMHEPFSRLCDVCHTDLVVQHGSVTTYQPRVTCPSCGFGVYCSAQCRDGDAQQHASLCGHLVAAHKRYANNSSSSSSSSSKSLQGRGGSSRRLGYHWHVLDLLLPEGGPLGTNCGALG